MRPMIFLFLVFLGLADAQTRFHGGAISWGDADDSTSSMSMRGATLARDSGGAWVNTADSCSKWFTICRGDLCPSTCDLEIAFDSRAKPATVDSAILNIGLESRYCTDPRKGVGCGTLVQRGRLKGTAARVMVDSVASVAADSVTRGNLHLMCVEGQNQIRACLSGKQMGGAAGDTTFWNNWKFRTKMTGQ